MTPEEPESPGLIGAEEAIGSIHRTLHKMGRKSAIVLGQAGVGKTALVREVAYRMVRRIPPFDDELGDCDILEMETGKVQADSKYAGTYEERLVNLTGVLEKAPQAIVFVDEIHSFFRTGRDWEYDVFERGNQIFKRYLSDGKITFIGCTTPREYRKHIAIDHAMARRFSVIQLPPPSREATLEILKRKREDLEAFYRVKVPDEILSRVIEITEDFLPARHQPDKSLQLLDETCVYCITRDPRPIAVAEEMPMAALETMIGRSFSGTRRLTEAELFERLREKIKGQDRVLAEISRKVVAGIGGWMNRDRPRGVFLFAGPTGVGKTETALLLAEILGGGRDALVRIDCNTLGGWGSEGIVRRLLGFQTGSGAEGGAGGALSAVRDLPESIVLFDEFEKADPAVGRLLLQIMDEGRVKDPDQNVLDFRRTFIVLTTNAGSTYDREGIQGFKRLEPGERTTPAIELDALKKVLRKSGVTEEFIGRLSLICLFQGLERDAVLEVLSSRLAAIRHEAARRNLELEWSDEVISHLADQWEPRYGVRHLSLMLRNRIVETLSVADAQGDLDGVKAIRLQVAEHEAGADLPVGMATHERRENELIISVY